MTRHEVYDHYTGCNGESDSRLADVEDASKVIFHSEAVRLATSLRNIIEGINDVASGSSNSIVKMGQLKKKVTSLSSFISFLDPARESVEDDGYLSAQPCDDDIGPTGSILCKFQGIDAMRKAKNPVLWFENPCMLDGYTFSLALKFEASWGKFSNVWAFFVLTPGQKDDFVEWPFAKHV